MDEEKKRDFIALLLLRKIVWEDLEKKESKLPLDSAFVIKNIKERIENELEVPITRESVRKTLVDQLREDTSIPVTNTGYSRVDLVCNCLGWVSFKYFKCEKSKDIDKLKLSAR